MQSSSAIDNALYGNQTYPGKPARPKTAAGVSMKGISGIKRPSSGNANLCFEIFANFEWCKYDIMMKIYNAINGYEWVLGMGKRG